MGKPKYQTDHRGKLSADIPLAPVDEYRITMKRAADRLPEFDNAKELFKMLFSKEELEWLKNQYATSP